MLTSAHRYTNLNKEDINVFYRLHMELEREVDTVLITKFGSVITTMAMPPATRRHVLSIFCLNGFALKKKIFILILSQTCCRLLLRHTLANLMCGCRLSE